MHLDMSVKLEKNAGMQPKTKSLSSVCRRTNISGNSLYKGDTEQDCTYSSLSKQNGNRVPLLKREN